MKRSLLLVIALLLLIAGAPPASAAIMTEPENVDTYPSCDSSMTPDECMWSPMAGGNYAACTAIAKADQLCVDRHPTTKECIGVWRNGYCRCDGSKLSGYCTFMK